jgi:hypothetical protein
LVSRNRKRMSKELFDSITAYAVQLDQQFPIDAGDRWIRRLSDADADLMSKADVTALPLNMATSVVRIAYGDDLYYSLNGFSISDEFPDGLLLTESTLGLFSTSILAAKIQPNATAAQVRDILEYQSSLVDGYEGHDLSVIEGLFPKLIFLRAGRKYEYTSSLERVAGSCLTRSYDGAPLAISRVTLRKLETLFQIAPEATPLLLPLQGLLSFTWQSIFMELYRCIEQLYSVPRLLALTKDWKYDKSLHKLSVLVETALGWRPKEDDALRDLLEKGNAELLPIVVGALARAGEQPPEVSAESAARRIYKLRNSCVHYRPTTQETPRADAEWDAIISVMADCVVDLYDKLGRDFNEDPH